MRISEPFSITYQEAVELRSEGELREEIRRRTYAALKVAERKALEQWLESGAFERDLRIIWGRTGSTLNLSDANRAAYEFLVTAEVRFS